MKIAIDATRAITEKAGIGRVSRELIRTILEVDTSDEFELFSTHWHDSEEKTALFESFAQDNVKLQRSKIPGKIKELFWGGPFLAPKIKADVMLSLSFFELHLALKIPQVVLIHDMATFLFPDQRGKEVSNRHNKRVKQVCAKAKKIMTVSQSTKNDLMKLLNIPTDKIQVIYPGNTKFPSGGTLPSNIEAKKYILFVGTLEPRKNLKRLIQAYKNLSKTLKDEYPLVIVGGKGWNVSNELKEIGNTPGVIWLGYVSDADLGEIYKNATILAYPSIYEGFGLPVIEAQQFGVPVLTSNVSSLPEAVGDGGLQIDPSDTNSITSGLQRLLEDKELGQSLGLKAKNHANEFSWEKAAMETLETLKEVAK